MFVLGVDPGLSRCGYCCLEPAPASRSSPTVHALGLVSTSPREPLPLRLAELRSEVREMLAELRPSVVVVEQTFFQVNVRTAMSVGQASGVVIAEAAASGAEVVQYTPNQVKQAVSGFGGASKEQVQRMVQVLLGLAEPPSPPDVADAAALALCHLACAPVRASVDATVRGER